VLAALPSTIRAPPFPQRRAAAPFPLREAGSFDGPRIDQAVTVTPFRDGEHLLPDRDPRRQRHRRTRKAPARPRRIAARPFLRRRPDRHRQPPLLRRRARPRTAPRPAHGGALSLLLTDIDSFKAYNDHFGHQQGDTCLSPVAQALAAMLKRPADVAARYGGEEFAAILPDTSLEQAHRSDFLRFETVS
jgi:predicted signal transduction protein with EAL and GGDEF domain